MAHNKRKVSAQTRVKLSQQAKKRKRGLKGTSLGGKFAAGAGAAHGRPLAVAHHPPEGAPKGRPVDPAIARMQAHNGDGMKKRVDAQHREPEGGVRPRMMSEQHQSVREMGALFRDNAQQGTKSVEDPRERERLVRKSTRMDIERKLGRRLSAEEEVQAGLSGQSITSRTRPRGDILRDVQDMHWRDRGVYGNIRTPVTRGEFIRRHATPTHKAYLEKARANPNSFLNKGIDAMASPLPGGHLSAGARRREDQYVKLMQQGYSSNEAEAAVQMETRGRKAPPMEQRNAKGRQLLQERGQARGMKSVYDTTYNSKSPMKAAVDVPRVNTLGEMKSRYPGLSENTYLSMQEGQRKDIYEQTQQNVKWTHETQAAAYKGQEHNSDFKDRVVFFTTSLGAPTASVPSDSLVGQYIIKKRARSLVESGLATQKTVKGHFPQAVRDMHLIEAGQGIRLGARGDAGLYSVGGWRAGKNKSKAYGKSKPFGASIMYDSQGLPMYDHEGNVVHTEGLTRRGDYSVGTAGLRVFVG